MENSYTSEKKPKKASGSKTCKGQKRKTKKPAVDMDLFTDFLEEAADKSRRIPVEETPKKADSEKAVRPKKTKIYSEESPVKAVSEEIIRPKKEDQDESIYITSKKSKKTIDAYKEAKDFLEENRIKISTITLDCKLHVTINIVKFAKYVVLQEDGVVSVKYGNAKNKKTNRSIIYTKPKKKPSSVNFRNQATILMKPTNNPERNYMNIKVFQNGSLQITGCKDMDDFSNIVNTLIGILSTGADIERHGETVHVKFIKTTSVIEIKDINIRMINSNFKLPHKVDRKKLASLLKKNHNKNTSDTEIGYVEFKYEPTGGHSCVNIKHEYIDGHKTSIFVFQTGAIIITGAKTLQHVIAAYKYIKIILKRYIRKIRIITLNPDEVKKEIAKYLKERRSVIEV